MSTLAPSHESVPDGQWTVNTGLGGGWPSQGLTQWHLCLPPIYFSFSTSLTCLNPLLPLQMPTESRTGLVLSNSKRGMPGKQEKGDYTDCAVGKTLTGKETFSWPFLDERVSWKRRVRWRSEEVRCINEGFSEKQGKWDSLRSSTSFSLETTRQIVVMLPSNNHLYLWGLLREEKFCQNKLRSGFCGISTVIWTGGPRKSLENPLLPRYPLLQTYFPLFWFYGWLKHHH